MLSVNPPGRFLPRFKGSNYAFSGGRNLIVGHYFGAIAGWR
jgi:hypothetical protein